jgi:hypothetical protein
MVDNPHVVKIRKRRDASTLRLILLLGGPFLP